MPIRYLRARPSSISDGAYYYRYYSHTLTGYIPILPQINVSKFLWTPQANTQYRYPYNSCML